LFLLLIKEKASANGWLKNLPGRAVGIDSDTATLILNGDFGVHAA